VHLRAAPVPQEHQCLGLDGYLYTTRGDQRWGNLSGTEEYLLVIDRLIDYTCEFTRLIHEIQSIYIRLSLVALVCIPQFGSR
jgi:hypothetical protein